MPEKPFRCTHILVWPNSHSTITSVQIGVIEQLTIPRIPAALLTPPVSLETIREWFQDGSLRDKLVNECCMQPLQFERANISQRITISYQGNIQAIALFGIIYSME